MIRKTVITMLMACLWCSYSSAEEPETVEPMLAEGRAWVYEKHHFEPDSVIYAIIEKDTIWAPDYHEIVSSLSYTLRGDTIIGGKRYYKNYRSDDGAPEVYDRAMREEGRCVYQVLQGKSENVAFDYSYKNMVKSILMLGSITETVDRITVRGRTFVRHNYYHDFLEYYVARVVEGVGKDGNGLMFGTGMIYMCYNCDYIDFIACYENGECIFTGNDFSLPVITDGILSVSLPDVSSSPLYDLQGRRLTAQPRRPGVYVQDGRKVVVK